jgi:hypothetical protein
MGRDDLGLISQLVLVTLVSPVTSPADPAMAAPSGGAAAAVLGRRATALLVRREAELRTLLRATAPPFVPASLRWLLMSDSAQVMTPHDKLQLPIPEAKVGVGRAGWRDCILGLPREAWPSLRRRPHT